MVKLLETVAQVAPSEATVLITGESGTGKEMIGWALLRSIVLPSQRPCLNLSSSVMRGVPLPAPTG